MKNILLAIDFSAQTNGLIEKTAVWAERFGAKLWLVHVAAPQPDFVGYEVGPQYIRDHRAEALREEHRQLQALSKELNERGLAAEALLIQGQTAESLVEEASTIHADLIVLGAAHDKSFFESLFNNVWQQVVNQSKIPVMIVPS